MIDCNVSVSAPLHECQIVTELPGGAGDKGCLGGSSVGVETGVPEPVVGVGNGDVVPLRVAVGVIDLDGVSVGLGVEVAGPGYGAIVFVIIGPG
jgi:hypothetical protein